MTADTKLTQLEGYSACDVSDALLKLNVPGAGFVPDLMFLSPAPAPAPPLLAPSSTSAPSVRAPAGNAVAVARASTVLFAPKGSQAQAQNQIVQLPDPNIPPHSHWADLTDPGTFVVIKQPDGQTNAVCGGIMGTRMHALGAKGILVVGRVRDADELRQTGLPIWTRGFSTVGVGLSSSPHAIKVPLHLGNGTVVRPGDVVFSDPANGVVVVPHDKLDAVLGLLPQLVAADDDIKRAVRDHGIAVHEAFARYRTSS